MKAKLYLILSVLSIIVLLSSAAICNLGQAANTSDTKAQASESENKETEKKSSDATDKSDTPSGQSSESSSQDDSDKKDENKPEDNKSKDENKPPVISGICLDGLDPIDYFFFTNDTYTARAEAMDPEGSSLTFKWSGDGTIAGNDINPMNWTAPDSEGVYKLTVEATDDKGNTSTFTSDVYVNAKTAVGEPPKGTEILDIEVISSDGKYYNECNYTVLVNVNNPLNEIEWYHFSVKPKGPSGSMKERVWPFTTPDIIGDINIRVTIADHNNKKLDEKTKTINIEPYPY